MRREERGELRRVEGRPAADADDAVEAVARGLGGLTDGFLVRLSCDPVVEHGLHAGLAERAFELLAQPGLGHEAVAHDERPCDAELAEVLAGLRRRARAEDDARCVESDDRGGAVRHRDCHSARPSNSLTSSKPMKRSPNAAVTRSRTTAAQSSSYAFAKSQVCVLGKITSL